jgi:hypothetical protein
VGKKVSNRGAAVLGVAAGVEKSKAKGGGGRLCLGFLGLGLGFPLLFFCFFSFKITPLLLKIQYSMVFIGRVLLGFQISPSTFPFILFSSFFCKF